LSITISDNIVVKGTCDVLFILHIMMTNNNHIFD